MLQRTQSNPITQEFECESEVLGLHGETILFQAERDVEAATSLENISLLTGT